MRKVRRVSRSIVGFWQSICCFGMYICGLMVDARTNLLLRITGIRIDPSLFGNKEQTWLLLSAKSQGVIYALGDSDRSLGTKQTLFIDLTTQVRGHDILRFVDNSPCSLKLLSSSIDHKKLLGLLSLWKTAALETKAIVYHVFFDADKLMRVGTDVLAATMQFLPPRAASAMRATSIYHNRHSAEKMSTPGVVHTTTKGYGYTKTPVIYVKASEFARCAPPHGNDLSSANSTPSRSGTHELPAFLELDDPADAHLFRDVQQAVDGELNESVGESACVVLKRVESRRYNATHSDYSGWTHYTRKIVVFI